MLLKKLYLARQTRYDTLLDISNKYINNIIGDEINILIDMNSVFNTIWQPSIVTKFEDDDSPDNVDPYGLSLAILNFIAHYRNFFWTRYRKHTNIYLYDNMVPDKWIMDMYGDDFKKNFYIHRIGGDGVVILAQNYYKKNISIVRDIITHVPSAYYVNMNGIDELLFPYMFMRDINQSETPTIIISNRQLTLINRYYFKNISVLSCKKEKSILAHDYKTTTMMMLNKNKVPNKMAIEYIELYIPFIYGLAGYESFNIKNKVGMRESKAIKMIANAIDKEILPEYKTSISEVAKTLYTNKIVTLDDLKLLYNNLNILLYNNLYFKRFSIQKIKSFKDKLIDISDDQILIDANYRYYNSLLKVDQLLKTKQYN